MGVDYRAQKRASNARGPLKNTVRESLRQNLCTVVHAVGIVNVGLRLLRWGAGMDLGELIYLLSSSVTEVFEFVHANFDPVKAITIAFAALSALTGIWIKWRNSGYRQVDRLREFIDAQEKRLDHSRQALASTFQLPRPDWPDDQPAFNAKKLRSRLRYMNWGFGQAASNDLLGAIHLSGQRAELANAKAEEHRKREALAHLLQGARLAARAVGDDHERCRVRTEALEHFRAALKIDSADADALEYALMMMLELANPRGVLAEVNDLVKLREPKGGFELARAFRLRAMAYEQLPTPQLGNANSAMIAAVNCMPDTQVLEKAVFHEHHGLIRIKARTPGVANQSLQEALILYQRLSRTKEGEDGVKRVARLIAELNSIQIDELPDPTTVGGNGSGWITKLSKQHG